MARKKAIVLLSGGLDSTVALWWAKKQGFACSAIGFNYGQRHARELQAARRVAKRAGVPYSIVTFRLPWSQSSLTSKKAALPFKPLSQISTGRIPSTYVPGRNTLFLSFALSFADQIGAEALIIGANAIDYSGYPDCRPAYLSSFQHVARLGSRLGTEGRKKIKIHAPLLKLTKSGIVELGHRLRAPMELTWSCYQGRRTPCGRCDSCQLRDKGFREATSK